MLHRPSLARPLQNRQRGLGGTIFRGKSAPINSLNNVGCVTAWDKDAVRGKKSEAYVG
jgi:hypothetical protein